MSAEHLIIKFIQRIKKLREPDFNDTRTVDDTITSSINDGNNDAEAKTDDNVDDENSQCPIPSPGGLRKRQLSQHLALPMGSHTPERLSQSLCTD